MKIFRSLIIFCFFSILFGACFDVPTFSIVPEIEYQSVFFKGAGAAENSKDTVILTIRFKDGDGDLGLSNQETDYPYYNSNYFLESNGKLIQMSTALDPSGIYPIVNVPAGATGKLATIRTRNKPEFASLIPAFVPCVSITGGADGGSGQISNYSPDYELNKVYISEVNKDIIDASYFIGDTISIPGSPSLYAVQDTVYYQPNPNTYNITVQYLINTNGTYTEFDWAREFCAPLDSRFPILGDLSGNVPLEGSLTFKMGGIGIYDTFSGNKLKLRIQIKDRALHESNTVESSEFTLDKIRIK
jgi:hypothetical protein